MANLYSAAANKLDQFMEGALDGEVKSKIRKKALVGGLCMAIPLWGIETIIYIFVLWKTYSEISNISGVSFKNSLVKNVISGMVINIIVTAILGAILDMIPVGGWIASFAMGYISLLMSGMGYVKALKVAHKDKAKLDLNARQGMQYMKNGNVSAQANLNFQKAQDTAGHAHNAINAIQKKEYGKAYNILLKTKDEFNEEYITEDAIVADDAPSTKSKTEILRDLKKLLDEGVLTEDEFQSEKKKILAQ